MGYNNRPLPSRKRELMLKLAEQCIVQEWSRISLRLRVSLKILGTDIGKNPFRLSLEAQVKEWNKRLEALLIQSDERRNLMSTVVQLRETLRLRNAITHGEPGWAEDIRPDFYVLYYLLARDPIKPREKRFQALPPPRLEILPDIFLEPEDAELHSFALDDMLEKGKGMKALRQHTEKLCDIAVARHRMLAP